MTDRERIIALAADRMAARMGCTFVKNERWPLIERAAVLKENQNA